MKTAKLFHYLLGTVVAMGVSAPGHAETASRAAAPRQALFTKAPAAPVESFAGVVKAPRAAESTSVKADFTISGVESLVTAYKESFDNGINGWSVESASTDITWTTKNLSGDKSFSTVEEGDAASLYVEGPYQAYKRAISSLTSPEVEVPASGILSLYVGYSLNYNDMASLVLSVSTDGFETSTELWNSTTQSGEKPWAWRYITVDMAAFAGQNVQFRFTYGPGTADTFGTGGYMADFAVDAFTLSGQAAIENISVMTGDVINLVNLSEGEVASYSWSMPGAVPATSTEANPSVYYTTDGTYDISLTVTDASGATSTKTCAGLVTVTGTEPVAKIIPPATFRLTTNRLPLVAPMAPVTFRDGSSGFPTEHEWAFMHVTSDPDEVTTISGEEAVVSFAYLHDKTVGLAVGNEHGASADVAEVTAEYSGTVTNLRPDDSADTFDMDDWGIFPGSNTRKITAYAECFSAPSVPVMITGAYVFFNRAEAEEVVDQIANVGVHLYTSENGLPGKRLDSFWWSVFELDISSTAGEILGTSFPFTEAPFVDDEFFIVVDGLPEYTETCCVSFAKAKFRSEGNTAYMLKDGQWISCEDYFPAGANHTSFMIYPSVAHSVMSSLADEDHQVVKFGSQGGTVDYPIFSYLGYNTPVESDSEWLRATGTPNNMTVDDIHVECDPMPAGVTHRTGKLTVTDGASSLDILVEQSGSSSITNVALEVSKPVAFPSQFTDVVRVYGLNAGTVASAYTVSGTLLWQGTVSAEGMVEINADSFPCGVVLFTDGSSTVKAIKK
ncbi:MAG: PKD domain-containing protein [Bacteroides sp.]|nr:PKD domain-containing protein [Bacteroides sp.]